jgi:hypothetical protein
MASFCEARRIAWEDEDWDADLRIEKSMVELENEFPEFYDRWFKDCTAAVQMYKCD